MNFCYMINVHGLHGFKGSDLKSVISVVARRAYERPSGVAPDHDRGRLGGRIMFDPVTNSA